MDRKKILVVGAGRSGTGFMSKVITAAGIPCGHEKVFGTKTLSVWGVDMRIALHRAMGPIDWEEYQAESSWLAVPWLSVLDPKQIAMVWVVRNPLKCAASFRRIGMFDPDAHGTGHAPYLNTVLQFAPGVFRYKPWLGRFAAYWTIWNEVCADRCPTTIQIEGLGLERLGFLCRCAGFFLDDEVLERALGSVPSDYNSRGNAAQDEPVTLEQVEEALDDEYMFERFLSVAEYAGYDLKEVTAPGPAEVKA